MLTLFDQLLAEGETGLQRLIDEKAQETVQLDFKSKGDRTRARFSDDDKKIYGKALSAFSNSSGGLIVWGIDCRKGADGLDCAQELVPISDIEQFYAEAIRLSGSILIPRHDGIRVERIASFVEPGTGYLLVLVERSERRPHRSEAKGDKQYYKRAGESSFPMEHYDIEDAFKRFSVPVLSLGVRFNPHSFNDNGSVVGAKIELFLTNTSSVTAKMPYLQERNTKGGEFSSVTPSQIHHHSEGEWMSHSADISTVIHPGLSRSMAIYWLWFDWTSGCKIGGVPSRSWGFYSECRFGCENLMAIDETIELDVKRHAMLPPDRRPILTPCRAAAVRRRRGGAGLGCAVAPAPGRRRRAWLRACS